MCHSHLYLLILIMLSSRSGAEDKRKFILFRPQHQRELAGSLYEFVGLQNTFIGAQGWCEKRGGHLAFIQNEETQYFLQSNLDPKEDTWLGLTPTASTNLQDTLTHEGPLSWMDGSPIIYKRWVSRPDPGAACGHILRDSGYQWKATVDCNLKLPFICQYETGRSIICGSRDTTLQCGSGQVLMIDGGFYGRKNVDYCRSRHSPPATPRQFQCAWMDITESLTIHCHGHQICRITGVADSFGELCPALGSYLSLDYHCKDGLTLWVSSVAAVIDAVTVNVKWLLHLPMGNLSCKLSTGDGRDIFLYSAERMVITVVHRYHRPGKFVVVAHCTRGDRHIAAQRAIVIQELIKVFDVITCYAGNLSFHATECKVLHGERLEIQVGVKSGTNVSYSIHSGGMLLSGLSVVRGNVPHNITIAPEVWKKLGPGCHQLKLCASNTVTVPVVSQHLQACVLERVAGLQASLLTEWGYCSNSSDITVGVSVERGAPLSLFFSLIGGRSSFAETREMTKRKGIFYFGQQIERPVQMKIRAWNAFSSLENDVDLLHSCAKDSVVTTRKKHIRVVRSSLKVKAFPSRSVYKQQNVTLSVDEASTLTNPEKKYQWKCKDPCTCPGEFEGLTHIIEVGCLPQPFEFNKYYFQVKNRADNDVEERQSICINFIPTMSDSERLICTEGCNQERKNDKDTKIKFTCDRGLCSNHIWYIKDIRDDDHWKKETRSCYNNAGTKPHRKIKDGGNEYTVRQSALSRARDRDLDITVGVVYEESIVRYNEYIIRTSSTSAKTTKNPATIVTSATTSTSGVTTTTSMTPATTTIGVTTPTTSRATATITTSVTSTASLTPATTTTGVTTATTSGATATITTSVTSTTSTASLTPPTTTPGFPIITMMNTTTTTTGVIRTTITDETSLPSTTSSFETLKCNISPLTGTILDAFKITCNTETPCSNCQYCFKTQEGKHLRCSDNNEAQSIFLPLGDSKSNYNLIITATANCNCSFSASTAVTTQVLDPTTNSSSSSVDGLKAAVVNAVAHLKEHGVLSGETVGQIFSSVSNKLNGQSDESNKDDKRKLREQMLDIMIATVKEVPSRTPEEVQVTAKALTDVVQRGTELSSSAQEEASLLLVNLSSNLLHMEVNKSAEVVDAASTIVTGTSTILSYSSTKKTSDAILAALTNTQSALLTFKAANKEPTIIQEAHVSILVDRVTLEALHTKWISYPNGSSAAFSLPKLPSNLFPPEEPVDIRMLSLDKNPFSWSGSGNISGPIGALSLTTKNGSIIAVENLREDIEILLPSPVGEQLNSSFLDLGNYSTAVIEVPSADTTLVLKVQYFSVNVNPSKRCSVYNLVEASGEISVNTSAHSTQIKIYGGFRVKKKFRSSTTSLSSLSSDVMVPSHDPLSLKLFLGYMDYPTDTDFVATTDMPHQGTTLEERYTWILEPKNLTGNTGVYYLVIRPIVGPGIKSINATLRITSFMTACRFWHESIMDWSDYGCRVGVNTSHLVTQCLCNHLTYFGSSFFVTPNLVDPSRSAELFGTFAENPVIVCFVGALLVVYLLALVWARRKDIRDTAKVKVTVLEDNDSMDEYRYLLSVSTGYRRGASTSSQVTITLLGADGNSEAHHLTDPKRRVFERGAVDLSLVTAPFSLGDLQAIRLWHNSTGSNPAWYVGNVMVQDLQTSQKWHFLCNSWLAIDIGDGTLDKVFHVSTDTDLKKFSNLFFMKTSKDFSDGHLWYSVFGRPPSSIFTCVQRVSCCFSLLLCTMLTSIMFYGIPTDPSEQTMDLGHFEFTWQQFMIGVQSSLIMFPVNILIVSIFRNTRPREISCCKSKTEKPEATGQSFTSQKTIRDVDVNVTLETVIMDITRTAHSSSEITKSSIPSAESDLGLEQDVDINAVLSVVEDFIKQNHKTSDPFQFKTHKFVQPQQSEAGVRLYPGLTVEDIQMKSNKTQHLYRQLCRIDKKLSLLGPSVFHDPHNYSQAVLQVHRMKGFLENQIFKSSGGNTDEPPHKLNPADNTDDGDRKHGCCDCGLPWWFIFCGWLLVITTSVVAGYFTMLYGLKFGKDRSMSWLASMTVSFFQSLFIIQPLKVLCLAVFFALVIKKVEDEDYQNVEFVESNRHKGEIQDPRTIRQDRGLYEPPPPADIERMRKTRILEQKAFAFIREILTYMGFMWMLLLVAYGQRDSNAFYLNNHIQKSFSRYISSSMSPADVFFWANTSLLTNLFGDYPGFITDGNSKLVGTARLRQLRVRKKSCQIAGYMLQSVPECHAPYSWDTEDMGSYDPGWNHSVMANSSMDVSNPWTYQTQTQLRSYPVWGTDMLFRGGGFVAELGPDLHNARSTLEYLFRNRWLDTYTGAIFVEFTVYNANVNLFCIITLLLETKALGAFQFSSELHSLRIYHSPGGLHIFVMAAEIIYLLFILYYMFLQGSMMKQQRRAYFSSVWNLLELSIILLSWSAVAIFAIRTLLGNRAMAYYQTNKDQFPSFYETARMDSLLQYLIAFLVLLSTVKMWHLFRLNPKMNIISATLRRASRDISGFLVIIVIILVGYSAVCRVIYGWRISSYRTLTEALMTIISLQIGIFNYDEVLSTTPVLGGLLFGSCILFMTFMLLNLLVSVILVAFKQEQTYPQPSDEEEIVDLVLRRICSLFGIGYEISEDAVTAKTSSTTPQSS